MLDFNGKNLPDCIFIQEQHLNIFGVVLSYIKGMDLYLLMTMQKHQSFSQTVNTYTVSSTTYREKKLGLTCEKSKTKRDHYCKELIKKISAV